jgi:hypothetical protein
MRFNTLQFKYEVQQVLIENKILYKEFDSQEIFSVYDLSNLLPSESPLLLLS